MNFRHLWKWDEHLLAIWYDVKAAMPAGTWLFLVLVGVGFLLQVGVDETEQLLSQAFTAEVLFPFLTAILSYRLILEDEEEQRIEFLSVRESLRRVWGHRLWSLLFVAMFSLGGMWLGWQIVSKETLAFTATLFTFAVPALALSGTGSILAFWVWHIPVADLALVFWWGFCILSYKAAYHILGPLYLFPLWYSLRVEEETVDVMFAKCILGAVGLAFISLSFYLLDRQKQNRKR